MSGLDEALVRYIYGENITSQMIMNCDLPNGNTPAIIALQVIVILAVILNTIRMEIWAKIDQVWGRFFTQSFYFFIVHQAHDLIEVSLIQAGYVYLFSINTLSCNEHLPSALTGINLAY